MKNAPIKIFLLVQFVLFLFFACKKEEELEEPMEDSEAEIILDPFYAVLDILKSKNGVRQGDHHLLV